MVSHNLRCKFTTFFLYMQEIREKYGKICICLNFFVILPRKIVGTNETIAYIAECDDLHDTGQT